MAIRDLLRACPLCRGNVGRRDTCNGCGTRFRRAKGDWIEARSQDGAVNRRRAVEWLDSIPEDSRATAGPDDVVVRIATPPHSPVRYEHELIGFVEHFGRSRRGVARLDQTGLTVTLADSAPLAFAIADIRAIQPTSSALQLRLRDGRVASLKFPVTSLVRWEEVLQNAVRSSWAELGRGAVTEFLPRIGCR